MYKGIAFALSACFVWGLIFIVPYLIVGFDAFEVVLGRHFVYGLLSCSLLFFYGSKTSLRYPFRIWKKAFFFAFMANIIYYTSVVVGVRLASPALTALLLGISPITICLYGNWREKECSFHKLFLPSAMIFVGLLLINAPVLLQSEIETDHVTNFLGIIASCVALVSWSWYVVANSRFLKNNADIAPQAWSTLMGTATFIWVIVLGGLYEGIVGTTSWDKFTVATPALWGFLGGSVILGVLCSWLGAYLWNSACTLLPVSLAGQLTIFETLFGLLFFYLLEYRVPPMLELFGILLMISAILYGINSFTVASLSVEDSEAGPS